MPMKLTTVARASRTWSQKREALKRSCTIKVAPAARVPMVL